MADLPAERSANLQDIKITLWEAIIKFTVLSGFILIGLLLSPITELYLIKSFFGISLFLFNHRYSTTSRRSVYYVSYWMVCPSYV